MYDIIGDSGFFPNHQVDLSAKKTLTDPDYIYNVIVFNQILCFALIMDRCLL